MLARYMGWLVFLPTYSVLKQPQLMRIVSTCLRTLTTRILPQASALLGPQDPKLWASASCSETLLSTHDGCWSISERRP